MSFEHLTLEQYVFISKYLGSKKTQSSKRKKDYNDLEIAARTFFNSLDKLSERINAFKKSEVRNYVRYATLHEQVDKAKKDFDSYLN